MTVREAKAWLRANAVARRRALGHRGRTRLSAIIARRVAARPEFRRARTVAFYHPLGTEVDTSALLRRAWEEGKTVLLPVTKKGVRKPYFVRYRKGDALLRSALGVQEPQAGRAHPLGRVDLVLVPGAAVDDAGRRIGYGGGYYDRILKKAPSAARIGLAFSCQRVRRVPAEPHDAVLDGVVTEAGERFRRRRERRLDPRGV